MKYTKGPWTHDVTTDRIGTTNGTITCLQDSAGWAGIGKNIPSSEQEGNAALIAKAPQMYEALTAMQHELQGAVSGINKQWQSDMLKTVNSALED